MSLINDMLNDLDQRRLNVANVPDLELFSVSQTDTDSGGGRVGLIMIALLLTGLVAGSYTPYGQSLWQSARGLLPIAATVNNKSPLTEMVSTDQAATEPDSARIVSEPVTKAVIVRRETRPPAQAMPAEPELIAQQPMAITESQHAQNPQVAQLSPPIEQDVGNSAATDQLVDAQADQHNTAMVASLDKPMPDKAKPLTPKKDLPVIRKARPLTLAQRDALTVKQARQLIQSGQASKAQQLLETVIAEYPQVLHSQQLLISQLLVTQQLEQAEQVLAVAHQQHGDSGELIKLDTRLLIAKGEPEQALNLLQNKNAVIKTDVEARELIAALAQQLGRYSQAVAAYRSLIAYDPGRANWWIGLAIALEASGDQLEAKAAYQRGTGLTRLAPELRQYAMQRLSML